MHATYHSLQFLPHQTSTVQATAVSFGVLSPFYSSTHLYIERERLFLMIKRQTSAVVATRQRDAEVRVGPERNDSHHVTAVLFTLYNYLPQLLQYTGK